MSVFTYDPNPPRVSSPWLRPADSGGPGSVEPRRTQTPALRNGPTTHSLLSEYGVTRLPPEPQEGPVEYKLHLLLRPRRAYRFVPPPDSLQSKITADPKFLQKARVVGSTTAGQTRQDRCQHLTTQLLWRLRQSSPYHASVAQQDVVLPYLPEDSSISSLPVTLGKLAPGLEESRGALYEIGVADDGTLVGITRDELDQSIATLRWMAANLGCVSEVLRMVVVGECEWTDDGAPTKRPSVTSTSSSAHTPPLSAATVNDATGAEVTHRGSLWVAEVFIKPHLNSTNTNSEQLHTTGTPTMSDRQNADDLSATLGSTTTNQIRVTLTGPTGSGKSTLLGTLSTGSLDDGHGKSRLNSLKHRHEMASGLTSTVTQELVGYNDDVIVNYANPNIESWIGIHDYTKNGRLVFISDSAGHPRFRRTTLRGLIGWAPHWTLLCLGAATDQAEDSPNGLAVGASSALDTSTGVGSAALAKAHLDLCLKLALPLAIIITKSDLLNKETLKRTLVPIWTAVKNAGRVPQLLQSKQKSPENVRSVSSADANVIEQVLSRVHETGGLQAIVPVVLTSAVSGDGIGLMHALLRALPLPAKPTAHDYIGMALNPEQPEALFHIEDRFSRPASYASANLGHMADPGYVLSGYLRFGSLSVGDRVVIGPFPSDDDASSYPLEDEHTASPSHNSLSSSHPSSSELARIAARNAISASALTGEWHSARIISIRNLRLPVQCLSADQVGTIGLVIEASSRPQQTEAGADDSRLFERLPLPELKPRRGMVVAIPNKHMQDTGLQLQAASGLTAFFGDINIGLLSAGTPVTFYVASVRAQARIAKIWSASSGDTYGPGTPSDELPNHDESVDGGVFGQLESADDIGYGAQASSTRGYNVRLELLFGREWIELGSKIVILEGASKEVFLLDGFIGKVVEIAD